MAVRSVSLPPAQQQKKPEVYARCAWCGNQHHSVELRRSASATLGHGDVELCARCYRRSKDDHVLRCQRCGNQSHSTIVRRRFIAGQMFGRPLCEFCYEYTRAEHPALPDLNPARMSDWATIAIALFLLLIPVLGLPRMYAFVRGYRLGSNASDIAARIQVTRLKAESSFTRARLVINPTLRTFAIEKYDKAATVWRPAEPPAQLSPGIDFGFGPTKSAPPGLRRLQAVNEIDFNSRGIAVDDKAEAVGQQAVYLTDHASTYAVVVSTSGDVSMLANSGHGWEVAR